MDSGWNLWVWLECIKARSHCTLNAHAIRFNAHWFAITLSRRECARIEPKRFENGLAQSTSRGGLNPV